MPAANGSPRCCTMPGCGAATAWPWFCRTGLSSSKSPGAASFPGSTTPRSTPTSLPTKSPTSSTTRTRRRCSSTLRWRELAAHIRSVNAAVDVHIAVGGDLAGWQSYEDVAGGGRRCAAGVGRVGDAVLVGHHRTAQGRPPATAGRRQRLLGPGGARDGADPQVRHEPRRACTCRPRRCTTPPG